MPAGQLSFANVSNVYAVCKLNGEALASVPPMVSEGPAIFTPAFVQADLDRKPSEGKFGYGQNVFEVFFQDHADVPVRFTVTVHVGEISLDQDLVAFATRSRLTLTNEDGFPISHNVNDPSPPEESP